MRFLFLLKHSCNIHSHEISTLQFPWHYSEHYMMFTYFLIYLPWLYKLLRFSLFLSDIDTKRLCFESWKAFVVKDEISLHQKTISRFVFQKRFSHYCSNFCFRFYGQNLVSLSALFRLKFSIFCLVNTFIFSIKDNNGTKDNFHWQLNF